MTSIPPPTDGAPPDPPQDAAPPAAVDPPHDAEPGPEAGGPDGAAEPAGADPSHDAAPQPGTVTSPAPTGSDAWRPWTAPAALLLWFGVTIMLSVVVAIAATVMGYSLDDAPAGVDIANIFAQDLAMIGAVLVLAHMFGRPRATDFGLRRTAFGQAIGAMLAVWVGFIAFSVLWKLAISLDDPQTLPDKLGIDDSTLNLVLVVIVITVLAPLGEELLFRGYIFRSLRNWRGFLPAAILTGLIFGAVHIGSSPIGYALPLAAFGFGLCLLYQWTGSLYPCIALHAVNNAFALGVDKGWGGEIALLMIAAAAVSVALAALLGRALDQRAPARLAGPVAPAA